MKTCTNCGVDIEKSSMCKECRNEYYKKYRIDNAESIKEKRIKRYNENCEKYKEYSKVWRAENKEKKSEYNRKFIQDNPIYNSKYYACNKEKRDNQHSEWIIKNPEKTKKYQIKRDLKIQIGTEPTKELVELKLIIYKTKQLCKTLKN